MDRRYSLGTTWIDPEDYAYSSGSLRQSARRAFVRCPDGVNRTARIGIPDTFFSIPARVAVRGRTVTGYVTVDEEEFTFVPYTYGKNGNIFGDIDVLKG